MVKRAVLVPLLSLGWVVIALAPATASAQKRTPAETRKVISTIEKKFVPPKAAKPTVRLVFEDAGGIG